MRRNRLPLLAMFCALGVLACFAWLSRHPDAELVREAEDWPVLGWWATRFRQHHLPPQPPPGERTPETPRRRVAEGRNPEGRVPEDQVPEDRTRNGRADSGDAVWLLPGTVLRREPAADSAVIRELDSIATATKIERRGDWFNVHHSGDDGWVLLEGYDEGGGPPYGDAPEPTKALMPRPPDAASLGIARELLGERERVRRLGPYDAYTDIDDRELFGYLDALAAQTEELYVERYGLEPLGTPAAALVLYRSELPYRVLEKRTPRLAGLHSAGHASRGIAVLYVGGRDRHDVGTTLVHELVHFLNRRALGPALPPWIDEGLADALATSGAGADGRIEPRSLGGERRESGGRVQLDGALATLHRLRTAIHDDQLPPLSRLTRFEWQELMRSEQRQLLYGASAFWIRYLLDGEDARLGDGLRSFLAGIAVGEPAMPEALRLHLGRDWAVLDAGFRRWILTHPALPQRDR